MTDNARTAQELADECKRLAFVLRCRINRVGAPDDLWERDWPDIDPYAARAAYLLESLAALASQAEPIDMVLHCPACGMQHIDAPKDHPLNPWLNPPHRSHLCHGCGHIWRPADVPTNGVQAVKTKGKADSPIVQPGQAEPTMADAIAAGDGTLHGAIDYWQQRAQAAEQEPFGWAIVDKEGCEQTTRARVSDLFGAPYEASPLTQKDCARWDREFPGCAPHRLVTLYTTPVREQSAPADFETWWEQHGQFCRAGGGDYEKTFAYRAWQAAREQSERDAERLLDDWCDASGIRCHPMMGGDYRFSGVLRSDLLQLVRAAIAAKKEQGNG